MTVNGNSQEYPIIIDTEKVGEDIKKITDEISTRVIGQSRAISHILRLFVAAEIGLGDPKRPIGVMFLAGPSGVGKTLTAKETARAYLGKPNNVSDYPLTFIQCSNLSQEHQTASLIGSPAGYIGYGDMPILHRINLEKHHLLIKMKKEMEECSDPQQQEQLEIGLEEIKQFINIVSRGNTRGQNAPIKSYLYAILDNYHPLKSLILFDEIEKAHPNVWNLLLGILEDGELQLASGEITDFRNSFIIITTNTGAKEIQGLMDNKIGFRAPRKNNSAEQEKLDQAIYEEAEKAIEKMFPAALIGRLGKEIVVFRTLNHDDYSSILEIFLRDIQSRLSGKNKEPPPILLSYTPAFKEFLIEEGTSQKYGARILRDVVKRWVIDALACAFSSEEIIAGEKVLFDVEKGKPVTRRQNRTTQLITYVPEKTKDEQ